MKRHLMLFLLLGAGSLLGCPMTSESKCPPKDGPCQSGFACDEADGLCKATAPSTETCETKPSLCSDAQTCDAAARKCVDNPAAPVVSGALIDRMGRPGVNTALTNPFGVYKKVMNDASNEPSNDTKDRYNKDGDAASWDSTWARATAQHIAIFDGLDKICGNQAFFNAVANTFYGTLAAVLAGDALHVDTSKSMCNAYLEVETGAPGCGGRRLDYDVMDATYGLLAGGTAVVTDGVANDSTFLSSFPFLAAPQVN